jgi:hypothetical protein
MGSTHLKHRTERRVDLAGPVVGDTALILRRVRGNGCAVCSLEKLCLGILNWLGLAYIIESCGLQNISECMVQS